MNPISPNLIESFIAFCEAKNISEAAKKMGITQPALSKQLKVLESQLPYKVFTFQGKKKTLTPFGYKFYDGLKEKIESIQFSINQICNGYGKPEDSMIKLAARGEILDRIAGKLKFLGRIDFVESSHEQIISNVMKGSLDLGITHSAPNTYELKARKIFKESFRIIIPKSLTNRKIKLDYASIPCVSYKNNDPILIKACPALGVSYSNLTIKRTCSNYNIIAKMVEEGLGWSIIPSHIEIDREKCRSLEFQTKGIVSKNFFLIYRPEVSQSDWFKDISRKINNIFC